MISARERAQGARREKKARDAKERREARKGGARREVRGAKIRLSRFRLVFSIMCGITARAGFVHQCRCTEEC